MCLATSNNRTSFSLLSVLGLLVTSIFLLLVSLLYLKLTCSVLVDRGKASFELKAPCLFNTGSMLVLFSLPVSSSDKESFCLQEMGVYRLESAQG